MKKIDLHCHFYPEEYVKEIIKRKYFQIHNLPVWDSDDARLTDMEKFNIERQVLSPSNPLVYFEDDALNLNLAQLTNDFLVDVCRRFPSRFSGFINVPLANMKHAFDELNRVIDLPGILGVTLGTNIRGKPLSSPEFQPFYEEADRLGLTIYIHPLAPIGIEDDPEYKYFRMSVGFLWETTMAVGRMALSGIFEKYRNIKWILSHLGGALPFIYTSMEIAQKRNPDKENIAPKPISEYLKRLYVDTARLMTPATFDSTVDLYGEEHIMFGTDIPYAYDVTSLNITRLEEEFNISDELRRKVFYTNARNLFKL